MPKSSQPSSSASPRFATVQPMYCDDAGEPFAIARSYDAIVCVPLCGPSKMKAAPAYVYVVLPDVTPRSGTPNRMSCCPSQSKSPPSMDSPSLSVTHCEPAEPLIVASAVDVSSNDASGPL